MKYRYFVSYVYIKKGMNIGQTTFQRETPIRNGEDIDETTDLLREINRCKKCVILNYKLMGSEVTEE